VLYQSTAGIGQVTELAGIVAVVCRATTRLNAISSPFAVRSTFHVTAVGGVVRGAGLHQAGSTIHQVGDSADAGNAVEALPALVPEAAFRIVAFVPATLVVASDDAPAVAAASVGMSGAGLALSRARAVRRAGPAVLVGSLAGSVPADRRGACTVGAEQPLLTDPAGPAAAVGAAVLFFARGPLALAVNTVMTAALLIDTV